MQRLSLFAARAGFAALEASAFKLVARAGARAYGEGRERSYDAPRGPMRCYK